MHPVLIIDDDSMVRSYVRALLEAAGYTVREAADGEEGLREFRRAPVPLVICDLLMPVCEGFDTMAEIRRISPKVRVLAITGGSCYCGADQLLATAKAMGADAVLAKPFGMEDLMASLHFITKGVMPAPANAPA